MDMGSRFRELIKRPEGLFGFGVATALDGAEAERQGAECVYAGGYSIAMAKMLPDMGMMNMVEVKAEVEAIARSVAVPVIADIDDGYGSALNVLRTASEFLGREFLDFRSWKTHRLAGIHLEDQKHPKRCGHIAGKEIVPVAEAADKISAASHVRNILCPSAVVISRTDAYHSGSKDSLDEAVRRSKAYADAGADLVWCEFNQPSREAAERFAGEVRKKPHADLPLAFNYSPSLPWYKEKNPMTFKELNQMGYKFIFVTIAAAHAGSMAVSDYMKHLKEKGAEALWEMQEAKVNHPTESHHEMARVPLWQSLERQYVPDAKERQSKAEGFIKKEE